MNHLILLATLSVIPQTASILTYPGKCPKITKPWDDSQKGRLDLERLKGLWRNVYDSEKHSEDFEC
jgi:hypothetical protein